MMRFEVEIRVAERLRRILASQSRTAADLGALSHKVSALDQCLGQVWSQLAGLRTRVDRFDERLSRVERRLDLVEA
jgi:hypothetical protein